MPSIILHGGQEIGGGRDRKGEERKRGKGIKEKGEIEVKGTEGDQKEINTYHSWEVSQTDKRSKISERR